MTRCSLFLSILLVLGFFQGACRKVAPPTEAEAREMAAKELGVFCSTRGLDTASFALASFTKEQSMGAEKTFIRWVASYRSVATADKPACQVIIYVHTNIPPELFWDCG